MKLRGMALQFDASARHRFGQFLPVHILLRRIAPVGNALRSRADHGNKRLCVIFLQKRKHAGDHAAVAVVKNQQYGVERQRCSLPDKIDHLRKAYRLKAFFFQLKGLFSAA